MTAASDAREPENRVALAPDDSDRDDREARELGHDLVLGVEGQQAGPGPLWGRNVNHAPVLASGSS